MVARVLLLAVLASVALAAPARAENAHVYANWNLDPAEIWNIDQTVRIDQKGASTYWASLWGWNDDDGSSGAYMGLQTDGHRTDGSVGELAIFSVWDATEADGDCGPFGGEGIGMSCRVPYPFVAGRSYRYRLWRLEPGDDGGHWWGAWIIDLTTAQETSIGSILVPGDATGAIAQSNFSEYFGPYTTKNAVPRSVATFARPQANRTGPGVYEASATAFTTESGDGAYTRVEDATLDGARAARATLGGSAPVADPTPTATPDPSPTAVPDPATPDPGPAPPATTSPPKQPAIFKCVIPSLKNLTLASAKTRLKAARCALGTVKRAKSRRIKAGRVIAQGRKAGTKLAAGTKVTVTVSRGRR
jgi:hypothetical protein